MRDAVKERAARERESEQLLLLLATLHYTVTNAKAAALAATATAAACSLPACGTAARQNWQPDGVHTLSYLFIPLLTLLSPS